MGWLAIDKNLGYIGADFKDSFAFVQSFGSGNPHSFQLVDKQLGEVIREGLIVKEWRSVKVKGHVLEVLEVLKGL